MKENNKRPKNKYTIFVVLALVLALSLIYAGYLEIPVGGDKLLSEIAENKDEVLEDKKELVNNDNEFDIEDYLLDEIDKEILETLKLEQIKQYRKYIINIATLTRKFLEDQNMGREIAFLKEKNNFYGKEVGAVIEQVAAYNDKYLACKVSKYEAFEAGQSLLKRTLAGVFDIKRENPAYREMMQEKRALRPQLPVLENHFHSVDFLKVVLSHD